MPTPLGAHNPRVEYARELLARKGRRTHGAYSFEGPTLLAEAWSSGNPLAALYVTQEAYEAHPLAREIEAAGVETFLVDRRTFGKLSDLDSPTGLLAVAPLALAPLDRVLAEPGVVLVLADLNDPGNAGTLLRSAEAFGVDRVIFGSGGVEPHHPKVVRAAMGALFRLEVALASAPEVGAAAEGWTAIGLAMEGEPLDHAAVTDRTLLLVGHERHGLGPWQGICTRIAAIAMSGRTESLNAAVAGSIALYEATKRR
ncbi:MAG TPA: RNA methyltransferase [Candidatus Baltobacteraceae bacterium]